MRLGGAALALFALAGCASSGGIEIPSDVIDAIESARPKGAVDVSKPPCPDTGPPWFEGNVLCVKCADGDVYDKEAHACVAGETQPTPTPPPVDPGPPGPVCGENECGGRVLAHARGHR